MGAELISSWSQSFVSLLKPSLGLLIWRMCLITGKFSNLCFRTRILKREPVGASLSKGCWCQLFLMMMMASRLRIQCSSRNSVPSMKLYFKGKEKISWCIYLLSCLREWRAKYRFSMLCLVLCARKVWTCFNLVIPAFFFSIPFRCSFLACFFRWHCDARDCYLCSICDPEVFAS